MPDYPDHITIAPLPGRFDVSLRPPGSKSLTNRALLLAALAQGTSKLTGVLFSDDTRVMMTALQQLGFTLDIDEANEMVTVEGRGGTIPASRAELHLGNAGTAMRFFAAACCLGTPGSQFVLDGIPRMRERPIGELVDALRQLGAKIEYLGKEGFPPLKIAACGLAGGTITLQPTLSSQFISALLIAAPAMRDGLTIHFDGDITSASYVEMTLALMRHFKAQMRSEMPHDEIGIDPVAMKARDYLVEPDASNASYFLAATAVVPGSEVIIPAINAASLQGDAAFVNVLERMGANVAFDTGATGIQSSHEPLRGIDIDLNAMPDMAQTLAVVACFAQGKTTIRNVGNLRVKETDRMAALKTELEKIGAKVQINGDDLTIHPPADGRIKNPSGGIDTYDDHRMAMAFSILGLPPGSRGITINDPGCVAKTYPNFWRDLERLRESAVRIAAGKTAAEAASAGAASTEGGTA